MLRPAGVRARCCVRGWHPSGGTEGVEDDSQARYLRSLQLTWGYLISRPLPTEDDDTLPGSVQTDLIACRQGAMRLQVETALWWEGATLFAAAA